LLEDNLIYNEPPDWHVPVRQSLGAVLLDAGRAAEAEAIYWQDLEQNRENGWSLFGLMQSLRAQGRNEKSNVIEKRFNKAWQGADVTLTASRFMGNTHTTMAAANGSFRQLNRYHRSLFKRKRYPDVKRIH
jgi:tetratricopeptide (TPR) repeat protein